MAKAKTFEAAQFSDMGEFYTAEDKAKLANDFVRFVSSGFKRTLFTKSLYNHVMNMWGHIAHYNAGGFYEEWFETPEQQFKFLLRCTDYTSVGSPAFTRIDVELALVKWLHESGKVQELAKSVVDQKTAKDLNTLAHLVSMYTREAALMLAKAGD